MPNKFMLGKNEKAVIAGFAGETCAQNAKKELEKIGVIDLRIDQVDYLPAPDKSGYDLEVGEELSHFDTDIILTIVVDEAKVSQAEEILKKHCARF